MNRPGTLSNGCFWAALGATLVLSPATASAAAPSRSARARAEIRAAYTSFVNAIAARDGAAACAALTPAGRAEITNGPGQGGTASPADCAATVYAGRAPVPDAYLGTIRIYGVRAAARTDGVYRLFTRARAGWAVAETAPTDVLAASMSPGRRVGVPRPRAPRASSGSPLVSIALALAILAVLGLAWALRRQSRRVAHLRRLLDRAHERAAQILPGAPAGPSGDLQIETLVRENRELAMRLAEQRERSNDRTGRLLAELTRAEGIGDRIAELEQTLVRSEQAREEGQREAALLRERLRLTRMADLTYELDGHSRSNGTPRQPSARRNGTGSPLANRA